MRPERRRWISLGGSDTYSVRSWWAEALVWPFLHRSVRAVSHLSCSCLQLNQALAGKFNAHVHVEYEWRLRHEDLDESDEDLDEKVKSLSRMKGNSSKTCKQRKSKIMCTPWTMSGASMMKLVCSMINFKVVKWSKSWKVEKDFHQGDGCSYSLTDEHIVCIINRNILCKIMCRSASAPPKLLVLPQNWCRLQCSTGLSFVSSPSSASNPEITKDVYWML